MLPKLGHYESWLWLVGIYNLTKATTVEALWREEFLKESKTYAYTIVEADEY